MASKKETVETAVITNAEQASQVIQLQNVGACAIRYKGTNYVYEQVFEVPESEIDRFRHEIFKGRVEFYDNPKRTREYIAAVKANAKEIVQPKSAE